MQRMLTMLEGIDKRIIEVEARQQKIEDSITSRATADVPEQSSKRRKRLTPSDLQVCKLRPH